MTRAIVAFILCGSLLPVAAGDLTLRPQVIPLPSVPAGNLILSIEIGETGHTEAGQEALVLIAELVNPWKSAIEVHFMNCSWYDRFRFDPADELLISGWPCWRNFSETYIMHPGDRLEFQFVAI